MKSIHTSYLQLLHFNNKKNITLTLTTITLQKIRLIPFILQQKTKAYTHVNITTPSKKMTQI